MQKALFLISLLRKTIYQKHLKIRKKIIKSIELCLKFEVLQTIFIFT